MSYREDLKAYLDGELPEGRAKEMEQALVEDPSLAREAREMEALSCAFKSVPAPVPHGMERTLEALTRAQRSPMRRPWGWWLGLGLASAAAATIAVTVFTPSFPGVRARNVVFDSARSESVAADAAAPIEDQYVAKATAPQATLSAPAYANPAEDGVNGVEKAKGSAGKPLVKDAAKKQVSEDKRADKPAESTSPLPAAALEAPTSLAVKPLQAQPVELEVASFEEAREVLLALANDHEGQLLEDDAKADSVKVSMTLEVPEGSSEKVMARLKELAKGLQQRGSMAYRLQKKEAAGEVQAANKSAGLRAPQKMRKIQIVLVPKTEPDPN